MRLVEQDVSRVIDNETVVALGSTLLGQYGFRDRAITRIDARTLFADPVTRPFRPELFTAFKADTIRRIALAYLFVHSVYLSTCCYFMQC